MKNLSETEKMSRRRFTKYVGGAIAVAAVAAAGYGAYEMTKPQPTATVTPTQIVTTTQPATTVAPPPVAVSLRGMTTSDPNFYLWDKDTPVTPGGLLNEYGKKTGTTVALERLDWGTLYEKSRLELQSQSPTYDYMCYDAYVRGSYLPNNWFTGWEELESKTGLPMDFAGMTQKIVRDCGTYEGKIMGVPSGSFFSPYFIYRRSLFEDPKLKDEFEKKFGHPLSPPNSWQEVTELSEFFTREINGKQWYGISLLMAPDSSSDEFYFRWLNMGGGKGGRHASMYITDENYEPLINNDIGVEALKNIVKIFQNKWCAPGGTEVAWVDITSNYFAGDVAMGYMWSCAWPGVDDPAVSKAAGDNGFHTLPLAPDGVNCHSSLMMAINRFGRHPEETYKFLQWLLSPEQDKRMALIGNNPVRTSTFQDPEVQANPMNANLWRMAQLPSVPQPDLPEFGEMNYEFSLEIQNAALGTKKVEQALDDTEAKWREILKKAGRL